MSSIKAFLKPYYHKFLNIMKFARRIGLKNKKVSIISNNCGGGFISQYFGLPYYSPTAGLLIVGDDFIKFVKNTKYYLAKELEFINPEDSTHYDLMKSTNRYGSYPVASCGDIEIFFMHYPTGQEASEKWTKRSRRVNLDNVLYVLFESDLIPEKTIKEFVTLSSENHICFTYNEYPDLDNVHRNLQVFGDKEHSWRPDIVTNLIDWRKKFNDIGK